MSKSRAQLQAELDEANDYIGELEEKLDSICDLAADTDDEDDQDGDGDEDE